MHALKRAYNPTLRILFEDECVKVSFNILGVNISTECFNF